MVHIKMEEGMANYFEEVGNVLNKMDKTGLVRLVGKIEYARRNGSTMFIAGNGGSASTSSHWVCDLMKGTLQDINDTKEKRLKVISLSDNIPIVSAYANDVSYNSIYSQQLMNLANKDDLLTVITGSGNSQNILEAITAARDLGVYTFGILGADGGKASSICDDKILVPSNNYGIIEDVHLMIGHVVTEALKGKSNIVS